MRSSVRALERKNGTKIAAQIARQLKFPRCSFFALIVLAGLLLPGLTRAQDFADNSKWEIGGHYATLNLPSQCSTTTNCDSLNNGFGGNLTYNFSSWIGLDTEMNFFGANGDTPTTTTGGRVTEGLFGFRFGPTTRRWGLYSVVRPGFVNFGSVLDGSQSAGSDSTIFSVSAPNLFAAGAASNPFAPSDADSPQITARIAYQVPENSNPLAVLGLTNATYFAFNYGEAIEYRPTKHAALRFDVGDTIIRYPSSTAGTPLHQHNFQISESLIIRF